MANHPNRPDKPRSAASTPTQVEIRDARIAADMTQTVAAKTIYATLRRWQEWEAGDARMHPGLFELFKIKVGLMQINIEIRA